MKALKGTAAVLSLAALTACGQGYTPAAANHVANPTGGGSIYAGGTDTTSYQTASYAELVNVITMVMGVKDTATPPTATCDAAVVAAAQCPEYQPLAYLAANQSGLGVPVYGQGTPLSAQASTNFTTGGFKAWILASSSAAGLMMAQSTPALFPKGVTDYTVLYATLLGRAPTATEVANMNALEADIATASSNAGLTAAEITQRQGAAVASTVLGSLEFLMVN